MDMSQAMQDWLEEVKSIANLTIKEQEQITSKGAEVFKNKLTEVTNAKHRSTHKDETYGHMADHISYMAKNADGIQDGTATVGWDNSYHAMNARHLNDGTKSLQADHFVDNARNDAIGDVLTAEQAEYQRILKAKEK